jgi:flagellar motor switch protein FliN/FliY
VSKENSFGNVGGRSGEQWEDDGRAPETQVTVRPAQFSQITEPQEQASTSDNLELIMDVPLRLTVELGRATMTIGEIVALTPGSVVELDKLAGEPVDVVVNGRLIAKGEVVVVDESFGVRLTDVVSPAKRAMSLS